MDTAHTTTRPAVDVGGNSQKPLLALVLGVLSVPGSTMAWDLFDGGGFVIGLPLAVAAIVVGHQARRERGGSGLATTGMVLAALMILMTLVWTIVGSL